MISLGNLNPQRWSCSLTTRFEILVLKTGIYIFDDMYSNHRFVIANSLPSVSERIFEIGQYLMKSKRLAAYIFGSPCI